MNNRIRNQKGISLISLIITIIVIIILAAIVIFEGFGATESAEFARFAQEFSDYQERVSQEYREKKTNNAINKIKKKDSEIYSEMGSSAGTVIEVLDGVELQEPLKGTNCYQLTLDREIYDEEERIYVTDKGEVFTLPGYEYETNGETRWYVNSTKYYIGEGSQGGQIGPNPYEGMQGHYVLNVDEWHSAYLGRDRQGNHLVMSTHYVESIDVSPDEEVQNWWGTPSETASLFGTANQNSYPHRCAYGLINNYGELIDELYGAGTYDEGLEYLGALKIRIATLDDFEYNGYDLSKEWDWEEDTLGVMGFLGLDSVIAEPSSAGLLHVFNGPILNANYYDLIRILIFPPNAQLEFGGIYMMVM